MKFLSTVIYFFIIFICLFGVEDKARSHVATAWEGIVSCVQEVCFGSFHTDLCQLRLN